jgi:hypothetical protein
MPTVSDFADPPPARSALSDLNQWGYFVQARILRHQLMVTCLDFLKNGFDFKDFDFIFLKDIDTATTPILSYLIIAYQQ